MTLDSPISAHLQLHRVQLASQGPHGAMGNVITKAAVTDMTLQWCLYLVASYFKTEKFYDLAGSSTFILLVVQSILATKKFFPRQMIQSGLVSMWAIRLGLFLFLRVMKTGHDSRFKRAKADPKLFLLYWTLQGLWVWLTLLPTLILNSKREDHTIGYRDYVGWGVWFVGMAVEMVADYQKYTFRCDPANREMWISHGLWSVCRHPNYLGEIVLWCGLFLSASSSFKGSDWLSVISPVFVALLLSKVSGIPILDKQNLRRWKDNPDFMNYFRNTPALLPF